MKTIERLRRILSSVPCYQTHTYRGEVVNEGIRGNERRALIRAADVRDKAILDLGCATGAECLWALEEGARSVCGVDERGDLLTAFGKLLSALRVKDERGRYLQHDLHHPLPPLVCSDHYDTVFAFAVLQHSGWVKHWESIPSVSVVYVESGVPCPFTADQLTVPGWKAELVGYVENHRKDTRKLRHLFRLERV